LIAKTTVGFFKLNKTGANRRIEFSIGESMLIFNNFRLVFSLLNLPINAGNEEKSLI